MGSGGRRAGLACVAGSACLHAHARALLCPLPQYLPTFRAFSDLVRYVEQPWPAAFLAADAVAAGSVCTARALPSRVA